MLTSTRLTAWSGSAFAALPFAFLDRRGVLLREPPRRAREVRPAGDVVPGGERVDLHPGAELRELHRARLGDEAHAVGERRLDGQDEVAGA